jgi:hypothetical protein
MALQQIDAELRFQQAHLGAQGGLRHIQFVSGLRDAAGLDDADEISELSQIDAGPLNEANQNMQSRARLVETCGHYSMSHTKYFEQRKKSRSGRAPHPFIR